MDENNRNFILAIVLSMVVLFGWQYFFVPKPKPPAETPVAAQQQTEQGPPQPGGHYPRQRRAASGSNPGRDAHARGGACRFAPHRHRHGGAQGLHRA